MDENLKYKLINTDMKIALNHNSNSGIKIGNIKNNLQLIRNNIVANTHKVKDVIVSNKVFKMNLIYFSSALSIILLLAFIQLFPIDNSIKFIVGLIILCGNVWIIQKNNL